jgi:hypothetical protein
MAQRIGWRSQHYAIEGTGRKTASRFSRPLFIRWAQTMLTCRFFLRAHNERNLAEYEGRLEIEKSLLADLIRCTKKLETAVGKLDPPAGE